MKFYQMIGIIFMCFGVFCVSGCGHQSMQAKSVAAASEYVERSLEESIRVVYDNPVVFLTRENPSECEPELTYEVEVYGEWRHVMIVGDAMQLEALKKKATEVSFGMPFEVLYLISQEVFVGQCGQKYYTLRLVP
jgi:hypothetical protein